MDRYQEARVKRDEAFALHSKLREAIAQGERTIADAAASPTNSDYTEAALITLRASVQLMMAHLVVLERHLAEAK